MNSILSESSIIPLSILVLVQTFEEEKGIDAFISAYNSSIGFISVLISENAVSSGSETGIK